MEREVNDMKKKMWLPMVILALTASSPACNKPATEEGSSMQLSAKSDSDLENTIKAKFNNDPELKAADLEVNANTEKNEATLSGEVESEALRAKALDLARSAQPGLIINDEIQVKPGEASRVRG
jgi:hypothetical protein